MFLKFTSTTGVNSLTNAIKFINDIEERGSNLSSYFKGLEGDIIQSVRHEFDSSNPNKWRRISSKWQAYKRQHGRPENIGIYTGQLLEAASTSAVKVYAPTFMKWEIQDVYSIGFTTNRSIGITTVEWIRGLGKRIANVIIGRMTTHE